MRNIESRLLDMMSWPTNASLHASLIRSMHLARCNVFSSSISRIPRCKTKLQKLDPVFSVKAAAMRRTRRQGISNTCSMVSGSRLRSLSGPRIPTSPLCFSIFEHPWPRGRPNPSPTSLLDSLSSEEFYTPISNAVAKYCSRS